MKNTLLDYKKYRLGLICVLVLLALVVSVFIIQNKVNSAIFQLNGTTNYSTKYTATTAQKLTSGFGYDGIKVDDINGDGYNDMAFCAYGATFGGTSSGSVYVVFGSASLPAGDTSLATTSNFNIRYDGAASYEVCSVSYNGQIETGDVNGDGHPDLIITAPAADLNGANSGSVWVIYSTLIDDITTSGNIISLSSAGSYNIRYDGQTGTYLGRNNNVTIADFNNDTHTDLLLGAPLADNVGTDSGSVWVMLSTLIDDVTTTGNIKLLSATASSNYNVRFDGVSAGRCATKHGIQVGDVNANNLNDFVLSCSPASSITNTYVYIIYDSIISTYTTTDQIVLLGTTTNYNVRYTSGGLSSNLIKGIRIGDINADGYKDLIMGGDYQAGQIWITYGTTLSGITGTNNQKLTTTAADYNVKITGATTLSGCISLYDSMYVQDINNDNHPDLILSTEPDISTVADNQGVWILSSSIFQAITGTGNALSMDTTTHYNVKIKNGLEDFTSIDFGDIDANGTNDLLLGMAGNDANGTLSGSVFAFSSALLASNMSTTGNSLDLTDTSKFSYRYDGIAGEYLGYGNSFIKDVTHDGHADIVFSAHYISRVWVIQGGSSITNLNGAYELVNAADNTTSIAGVRSYGIITGRLKKNSKLIVDVSIDFSGADKNWSSVAGDVDTVAGKSVVSNLSSAPGASANHTLYVPNPTGTTNGGIIFCPSATTLTDVTNACAGGTTMLETDPSVSVSVIDGQSYWVVTGVADGGGISFDSNSTPTASVTSGNGNLYAGKANTVTVVYSDNDGYINLNKLYFRIDNPSGTSIEYYGVEGLDGTTITPVAVSGNTYLDVIRYDRVVNSPNSNSITLTWRFTIDWTWAEDSTIRFGAKSIDDSAADSGYSYVATNYSYENDLDFTGTLTATGAITGALNSGDWVRPGENITWSGLKVVYEGTTNVYPPDLDFAVTLADDGGHLWYDGDSSGSDIHIVSTSDSATDPEDIHTCSITDITSNGSAVSGSTKSFTIRVDATPPDNVTNFTATPDSISQITLSWTNPLVGFDHVVVRRRTDTYPTSPANGTSVYSGTAETYVNTGLAENTTYYYAIFALDSFSNASSGVTVSAATPPDITNVTPAAPVISGEDNIFPGIQHNFTVVYSDSDGAADISRMYVQIHNPSGTDIEYYAVYGANGTNIAPTNVSGSSYVIRMAYNRVVGSPNANSVTLTWQFNADWDWTEDTTIKFRAKTIDGSAADSGWVSSSGEYTYENDVDLIGTLSVTGAISGVLHDGDWVRPAEKITWTGLKEVYEGTTNVYPPNLYTGVSVRDDAGRTWYDGDISGKNFYIVSTADSLNDPEDIHTIQIVNISSGGSAVPGSTKSFTLRVDKTPPASVSNFTAIVNSTNQISLNWTNPTIDFDHVVIRRRSDTFPTSPTNGTSVYSGTGQSVINTGLTENTKYYYTAYAYDIFGNYSAGALVSATTLKAPVVPVTPEPPPVTPPSVPETPEDILDGTVPEIIDLPKETEEPISLEVDGQTVNYTNDLTDQLHVYEDSTVQIRIPADAAEVDGKQIDKVYVKEGNNWYKLELHGDYYVGTIDVTATKGESILSAIVLYKDKSISEIKLPYNIDPYGYIYTKKGDNELRLKNVKVALYVKIDGKEELWKPSSEKYSNPQVTEKTGEYAFYVKAGEYKLIAKLDGYKDVDTGWFTVKDGVIEKNIEMKKEKSSLYLYILLIIIGVLASAYLYKKIKQDAAGHHPTMVSSS